MIELLNVALNFGNIDIPVGRLFLMQRRINFEFDANFLKTKYEISPFRLIKKPGLECFDPWMFEGLPGVFNDSLPDGWGRLLFDRAMRAHGVSPGELTPLDRLSHVGRKGMGALIYEPEISTTILHTDKIKLDSIANYAANILNENNINILDQLVALNGSSAGARPKALIGLSYDKQEIIQDLIKLPKNFEHWIVKFANSFDGNDVGATEHVYSQMAKMSGIDMPETYLFTSKQCKGYFAIKRFDRDGNKKFHTHRACGLLHSDFRTPSLDYTDLIQLTLSLTKNMEEVEKIYRLAVFNVCAHNRDDHSKNFSFLMDEEGDWRLSPAYDLIFSFGPNGEQSTTVLGEGRNPGLAHLYRLAAYANISKKKAQQIIAQCQAALSQWNKLAKDSGVNPDTIKEISAKLITTAE